MLEYMLYICLLCTHSCWVLTKNTETSLILVLMYYSPWLHGERRVTRKCSSNTGSAVRPFHINLSTHKCQYIRPLTICVYISIYVEKHICRDPNSYMCIYIGAYA